MFARHSRFAEVLECRTLLSATLRVGASETYKLPSQAIAAAHDGDTILIDPGTYNDVAGINKNNLTIEGAGTSRPVIKTTNGAVFQQKGLWVFETGFSNLTVKNIDFEGARVSDANGANGAGIRAQGQNLTVINCRFYNNQDGILGGLGKTVIEYSEFDHNGLTGLTHNVYISDPSGGQLIFEFNYSHDSQVGHLLKSRDAVNLIAYNRLSDNLGAGSYELDLPNGGRADIIGNIIQQSAASQNHTIFAYGEEGNLWPTSALYVVNNTFVNNASSGTFINAPTLPTTVPMRIRNNIFAGPGVALSINGAAHPVSGSGNLTTTVAKAGFVNAASFNYHLLKTSPAINIGVSPGADSTGFSLTPLYEYVFPASNQKRPVHGALDAGAYEY